MTKKLVVIVPVLVLAVVAFLFFGINAKNSYAVKASKYVRDLPYPEYMTPDYSEYDGGQCPMDNCSALEAKYEYRQSVSSSTAWSNFLVVLKQKGFTQSKQDINEGLNVYTLGDTGSGEQCTKLYVSHYTDLHYFSITCEL